MTKQSANRHNKQRQGSSKPVNNASSTRPQTSVKPAQTATKANGTVATKPVDAKANGATSTKSAPMATKSGSGVTIKPAQPSANVGSLKRAQQRKQQKTKSRSEQQRIDARNTRVTVLIIRNNAAADPLAQAETIVDTNYQPVDGVYCDTLEQSVEHIHAHLSIYINGANVPLVANTGIAPVGVTSSANVTCYYWLHTHDASGVVHIESPTKKPFTLNQFLDVWEKFSSSSSAVPTQLLSSTGWVIFVNGKQVNTDFSHLQLHAHDIITIAYNSPGIKPDTTYAWQGL